MNRTTSLRRKTLLTAALLAAVLTLGAAGLTALTAPTQTQAGDGVMKYNFGEISALGGGYGPQEGASQESLSSITSTLGD
jgi:hypothetical protein